MTFYSHTSGNEFSGPDPWIVDYRSGGDGRYEYVNGYRRLKFNNYQAVHHTLTYYTYPGYENIYLSYADVLRYCPQVTNPNLYLETVSKLADLVNEGSVNLGCDIATGRQTVDMVVDTCGKLGRSAMALRKGNFALAARQLGVSPRGSHKSSLQGLTHEDASALWLELQYGWKPLLSDVYDLHKRFVENTAAPRKQCFQASKSFRKFQQYGQGSYLHAVIQTDSESYKIVAVFNESVSVPRSLGLVDPASILWEICPWSFVADWFLPIGSYLQLVNQVPSWNASYQIYHKKFYDAHVARGYLEGSPSRSRYIEKSFSRSQSTSLDIPLPRFKNLPQFGLSLGHFENAVALLSQRVSK